MGSLVRTVVPYRVLLSILVIALLAAACGSEEEMRAGLNQQLVNPAPQGTGNTDDNNNNNNTGGTISYVDRSSNFTAGPTQALALQFPADYAGFCTGTNATWTRDAQTPSTVIITNPNSCQPQVTLGANYTSTSPAKIIGIVPISATESLRFTANIYRRSAPNVAIEGANANAFISTGYCEATPFGQRSGPHNFLSGDQRMRLRRTDTITQFRDNPGSGCNYAWNRFFEFIVTTYTDPTPMNLGTMNDAQVSIACNDVAGYQSLINRGIAACQSLCPFSATVHTDNGQRYFRMYYTGAAANGGCNNSSNRFTLTNPANTQCYNSGLGQARMKFDAVITTPGGSTSVPLGFIDFETDNACF